MRRPAPEIVQSMVGGVSLVRISGEINESFDHRTITAGPAASIVVFDLDGVVRVSSYGLSQWVLALEGLVADYYCFVRVRPPIVDQFNMVRAFAQRGELISLYAPFRCPSCDQVVEQLIDLRRDFALIETMDFPPVECPKCKVETELDELPEMYFRHVRAMPRPQPPAAAAAAIDGKKGAATRNFHIQKDVSGMVTAFWLNGVLDEPRYFRRAADGVDGLVVVELSAITSVNDHGLAGMSRFLRDLPQGAVLARAGATMIEPLSRMFAYGGLESVRVVSISLPFVCRVCRRSVVIELHANEARTLATGDAHGPRCPTCRGALEVSASPRVVELARRLPFGVAVEPIERYLRAHPELSAGDDALGAALANPRNLLVGKYQIIGALGEGGMGEVFLVRQFGPEGFTKKMVLKRVKRHMRDDPASAEMFLEEARIAARLSHPNAVQAFSLERIGHEYFMAMELIDGVDLARALRASREAGIMWPVTVACRLVAAICAGLHAAHTAVDELGRPAPIIHRDVSPDNVLISTKGEVKVTDFGIASAGAASEADAFRGKLGYCAPELLHGAVSSRQLDIYGAGAILFEALTLERFRPDPEQDTLLRASAPPPLITPLRADVPARLEQIYLRAVDPVPERRHATADELARELEEVIRDADTRGRTDFVAFLARQVALSGPVDQTLTGRPSESLHWTQEDSSESVTQAQPIRVRRRRDT